LPTAPSGLPKASPDVSFSLGLPTAP
jgi:hypothetical protein